MPNDPVQLAAQYGHIVRPVPHTARRWACTRCDTLLWADADGVHGTAVRDRCPTEATVSGFWDEDDEDLPPE